MAGNSYQMQSNLGIGQLSTANSSLSGEGSTLCFTAASASGTSTGGSVIKCIKIKSTNTSTGLSEQGMIRLFIFDGENYHLFREISVNPTTQNGVQPTFRGLLRMNMPLKSGYQIYATTENTNSFNVFVCGLNIGNSSCSTSVNFPSISSTFNTGITKISTANPNIDGSGAVSTVLIAATPGITNAGTIVKSINIKGLTTTSQGLVRLFVNDGETSYLWGEVVVRPATQSGTIKTVNVTFPANLILNPGYSLLASTQNGDPFTVQANGADFSCCSPD